MKKREQADKSNSLRQELRQQRSIIFGNNRYWFHVVIWLTVFGFLFFSLSDFSSGLIKGLTVTGLDGKKHKFDIMVAIYGVIGGSVVSAIIVYTFLLLVIPFARYKMQKRYLWLALLFNTFLWIGILILTSVIMGYINGKQEAGKDNSVIFLGIFASISFILTAYFFSFYYFVDLYDQQKNLNRYQQIFTDKLQAETNFLKTQINPHFLFNTLNNIYSLTLGKSDDAPRITLQLKDLITYMVNDCVQDTVPLSGEVNFLKNYIALEQLRNRQDNTVIELDVKGDMANRQIAPLLLVNFIENAFKHGVKAGIEQSFVKVRLYVMDKMLAMEVANSKPPATDKADQSVKQSGGIGIRNVKRRLEILYPNRYKLRINQTKTTYSVHLNINL